MGAGSRKCTAVSKSGEVCRAWATIYSDPPLCAAHNGKVGTAESCSSKCGDQGPGGPLLILLEQYDLYRPAI